MTNRFRRFGAGLARGTRGLADGIYRHDCLGLAAQVAYSSLFSLFPFLLFLRGLTGYIPGTERLGEWLLAGLRDLVTEDSRLYQIVQENVFAEIGARSAALLSIGIVLTLWSASGAVMTLINAANRAYGLEEKRSWFWRRPMAAGMAIAGAVLLPAGILLLVFGSWIGDQIGNQLGYDSVLHVLWVGLRWPVVFILLVAALGAFFYVAPSARQRWFSVLPGALFSVAAIMGVSVGLSWFLSQSVLQVRWLTYGVIGTAIVLLFWAFLIGLMILVGGEINAAVHRAVVGEKSGSGGLVESPHDE
jgi:membrane protein